MIARKSLLVVIAQFFTRSLGWIGLVVLAKLWGGFAPEALGVIGFAMAFIGLFNVIGDLGFGQAHVKRISEGKDLGSCIGTFVAIKIMLTSAMVAAVVIGIFIWRNLLHGSFVDATTESVVLVFLVYFIFSNMQNISTATFNGRQEIAKLQITTMFENIVKVPLTIVVVVAGVSIAMLGPRVNWPEILNPLQQYIAKHAVGSLAMTYVFGIITSCIVGFLFLRKYPFKKPSMELGKSYLVFALPVLAISIIVTISTNIDKIMIGFYWTATEVGYYFSVQQILQIILIVSQAMITVLFPAFSKFHSMRDFRKLNETTLLAERYISLVMIPVIVVIILFAKPIISIMLNSSFYPAVPVLIVLAVYALIISFMAPFTSLIAGMNRPGAAAKNVLMICIINIPLNFLFIPQRGLLTPFGINGPTGAAVATATSAFVGLIGLKVVTKKLTGIKLLQNHTLLHIVAGAVMAGFLYVISLIILIDRWFSVLVFAGVGILVYLGVLYILKEFRGQDFRFFLNILHPKKMMSYIKTELDEEKQNIEK